MLQISKKQVKITVISSPEKLNELEALLKNYLKNIYRTAITSPIQQAKNTGVTFDYLPKL